MKSVTVEDFDEAVKHDWSAGTCILAQAANRYGIDGGAFIFTDASKNAVDIMRTFDEEFWEPGDEKKPRLQALRASLPIEVKI